MSGKKKSGAWKAAKSIAALILTVAVLGGAITLAATESGLSLSYNGTTYSAGESVRLPPAREYTFGIEKPLGIVKKISVKCNGRSVHPEIHGGRKGIRLLHGR